MSETRTCCCGRPIIRTWFGHWMHADYPKQLYCKDGKQASPKPDPCPHCQSLSDQLNKANERIAELEGRLDLYRVAAHKEPKT